VRSYAAFYAEDIRLYCGILRQKLSLSTFIHKKRLLTIMMRGLAATAEQVRAWATAL
jgi:hypothetical protein